MHISPESLPATRPMDTADLEESEAFWRAAMDEQIAALPPEIRDKISNACAEIGVGKEATRTVLARTCDLIDFEKHGRNFVLTTAQRFESIKYVQDAARDLAEVMRCLPLDDHLALMGAFRDVGRDLSEHERLKLEHSGLPHPLVFSVMALAAQRLLEARPDEEGKGGRRPLRMEYSRFVSSFASAFNASGLPVGRGGAFERLCTVVFEVAGVRATPEGAIRFYLSERKKLALDEPENSGTERGE